MCVCWGAHRGCKLTALFEGFLFSVTDTEELQPSPSLILLNLTNSMSLLSSVFWSLFRFSSRINEHDQGQCCGVAG